MGEAPRTETCTHECDDEPTLFHAPEGNARCWRLPRGTARTRRVPRLPYPGVVRAAASIGLVAVLSFAAGCDSADSFVTARVETVGDQRICLDAVEYDDVDGCYPARAEDISALTAGDCIDVRIPNQLEPAKRDDPLYGVKKLGVTACRR